MKQVQRFNIYSVNSDRGWEKRPSPKGDFVTYVALENQFKKMQEIVRSMLLANNPDVLPQERKAIYKEAFKAAGLPEPKESENADRIHV